MNSLVHIPSKQKVLVMVAVILSMFLSALDQTIVSTALPTIVTEFNSLEHLSWVVTAYMLASTIAVPIYGKLSDMYGRKGFYLASIVIFLVGSALCGVAQNMTQLIIFRAIQGIGGGSLMTNSFAIIADLFTIKERARWQGLMGGVFGLSSVFGPILGGFFVDNLSWRWIFYINMPIGAMALLGVIFLLPRIVPSAKEKGMDFFGALYLAMGLIPLLLALSWGGQQYAWNSVEIILMFMFAAMALTFFVCVETLVKNPILPMELFKKRVFSLTIFLTFLNALGMFGVLSYIPLFAQKVVGVSATNSGTIMFPMMFGMIAASVISGQIVAKTQAYKVVVNISFIIIMIAMFFLSQMDANTDQMGLTWRMVIIGMGLGTSMPIFNIILQNTFSRSKIGVVTASAQLFRSVGGSVGVAMAGAVFNSVMTKEADIASAIAEMFHLGFYFMIGAFVISLFLPKIHLKDQEDTLTDVGIDIALEEGQFAASHEPKMK
ncbi:MFS transporter [Patescibacteria group bacterium]|nr:MFS transporter [Patescibacteria group bacterium]